MLHRRALVLSIFMIIGILFLDSCAKNPVTGKKEFMLMGQGQELALGQEADPQIISSYGLYDNKNIQDFINLKGKEMGRISHRNDLQYQFRVLDSPVVNAFAVPGGFVYFTRGILAHFNNEAEFMGVLGHEIGHIAARHSAKQYSQSTLAQIGLAVGAIFAPPQFADFVNAASTGMQLMFLKFGRDDETESDRLGVEYSSKVGYDAHEMAHFFSTINRLQEQAGAEIPTFLSTHPNPVDRRGKVNGLASKWQKDLSLNKATLKVRRNEYLRMIDGMTYGEDPRQGFFESNHFYHPDMKFYFPVPGSWQTLNSPSQVQMAPQSGEAMMVLQLAQQKTPTEAASAFVQENQLKQIQSQAVTLHGKQVHKVLAEQNQTDANGQVVQSVRVLSYFILHNNMVFQLFGITESKNYTKYETLFSNTLGNFRTLTETDKLSRQAEKINVVSVSTSSTLSSVLRSNKISADRLEEFAILNGMKLTDKVTSGTLVKVLE